MLRNEFCDMVLSKNALSFLIAFMGIFFFSNFYFLNIQLLTFSSQISDPFPAWIVQNGFKEDVKIQFIWGMWL